MTKTFKLVREFSSGTRLFSQEALFIITPGHRHVDVVVKSGENTTSVDRVDISTARLTYAGFLALKEGRFGGGFMGRWVPVKN